MSDFVDLVAANVIGNSLSGNSRSQMAEMGAQSRAKSIEDNTGLKPQNFHEYRSEHGGSGLLKGIGVAIVTGVVVGGLLALTPLLAGTAAALGVAAGLLGGAWSMGKQEQKVQQGYSNYLDGVAAQGRELNGRGVAHTQEYDNGADRTRSHAGEIAAIRARAAYQGNDR